MSNLIREIESEDMKINTFIEEKLAKDKILIPTFQREFVWEPKDILKLWDSIYRFYPIGSILYWVTDSYLHTHRKLGGFVFPHEEDLVRKFNEWAYILDGQQRATSLLVSILGDKDKIKGEDFDYTVYFDLTQGEFFFVDELDKRKSKVNPAFLVRLRDVPGWSVGFYKEIASEEGYNVTIERNLEQIERVFKDYKLVLVKIQGVDIEEVCEIFERINQEGKKLNPVDIVVARTYRNENPDKGIKMFYLRDNLQKLKELLSSQGNRFKDLTDFTIVQMVSICLRKEETGTRKSFGITPTALNNLTTEDLENNWDISQKTIFETIKFLSDLKIHGPNMLPFGYILFPLCYHFHRNTSPNLNLAKQWFWRNAFGLEDFRKADQVYNYCTEFIDKLERGGNPIIPKLVLSKSKLVDANYNYRNALSRAVLAFLAKQNPIDFSNPDAEVLDNVYLNLSHTPNLHHIYPRNFLEDKIIPESVKIDSLMNICYLRASSNKTIRDRPPFAYFSEYKAIVDNLDRILESHLIPKEFIERKTFKPEDYRDFLYARAELFCQRLKDELPDVEVEIVK